MVSWDSRQSWTYDYNLFITGFLNICHDCCGNSVVYDKVLDPHFNIDVKIWRETQNELGRANSTKS